MAWQSSVTDCIVCVYGHGWGFSSTDHPNEFTKCFKYISSCSSYIFCQHTFNVKLPFLVGKIYDTHIAIKKITQKTLFNRPDYIKCGLKLTNIY